MVKKTIRINRSSYFDEPKVESKPISQRSWVEVLIYLSLFLTLLIVMSNYLIVKELRRDIKKQIESVSANVQVVEIPVTTTIQEVREVEKPLSETDYYEHYLELKTSSNHQEWFVGYKVLTSQYEAQKKTIYEVFSEEEINILFKIVETECHGSGFDSKARVARVIYNRLFTGKWGDTLMEVMTSPSQFAIANHSIPEDTKLACEYAWIIGCDEIKGATAFHSGGYSAKFNGMPCVYNDENGHYFYSDSE